MYLEQSDIEGKPESYSVEKTLNSLSQMEKDLDIMNTSKDDINKKFNTYVEEEIEILKTKLTEITNIEVRHVLDQAKKEADEEVSKITEEGEKSLDTIKKKIENTFDKAVDIIITKVLTA